MLNNRIFSSYSMLKLNTSVSPTFISTTSMGRFIISRFERADRTITSTNCFGLSIVSRYILFILIRTHVTSCGFLSKNGVKGNSSFVPPSTYIRSSYFPHAKMKGTAMLMHTASMIFIFGCVSFEK